MCLNSILLDNTPLYADILSVINDYSVGDKSYWKGKFNSVVSQINQCGHLVWLEKYDESRVSMLNWEFKQIVKSEKLNTKKKLIEWYIENGYLSNFNTKEFMRMKKKDIISYYSKTNKCFFANYQANKNNIYFKYLSYYNDYNINV
jgi:hypothetical protein